jgi:N-methylhydantoinase B/oxoprolinase/acetone carboxylase alpha subunit
MTTANYTKDQVTEMTAEYLENPTKETVEHIAEGMGKSVRSVIGKLSTEGVYIKAVKVTKNGKPQVTKAQWVAKIEEATGQELTGLEKAPKITLERLFASF